MQLPDDGHAPFQLGPEGELGALAEPQQTNQDVLFRVLVGQEGLPAAVGIVVPTNQLNLRRNTICLITTTNLHKMLSEICSKIGKIINKVIELSTFLKM